MEKRNICELCTLIMGQSPDSKSYNSKKEGLPFFQGNADFGAENPIATVWCTSPKKVAEKGDILISVRAPIGDMNIANEKCCIGRGLAAIRLIRNDLLDRGYLYSYLESVVPNLQEQGTGSTFKAINKGSLESIIIPCPSLEKQQEISQSIVTLKNAVRLKKEQILYFDDLVQSRFIEMFGDPETNEKCFVKAPMGDYMTLLTDFSSNGSYKTLDNGVTMYDEPNYAWMVRTTDLESGDMSSIKYIDEKAYELLAKSKIFGGEIIMNKIGSAGKVYLMPPIFMPASLGRNAFMFRYDERINVKYLYYLLDSDYGQNEIQQYVRGAITKTITKNDARAVKIIVPPKTLQDKFGMFVEQVGKSKHIVQKQIACLQELLDSKMQEYFG